MVKLSAMIQKNNQYHIMQFISISFTFLLSLISAIELINHFDLLILSYSLFYLLYGLCLITLLYIRFKNEQTLYLISILFIVIFDIPMVMSMVLTIMKNTYTNLMFDWMAYAYACYATIKVVFAIKRAISKDKIKTAKEIALSYLNIISALYTVQALENILIETEHAKGVQDMYVLALISQFCVFVFTLITIVIFIIRALKQKNVNRRND